MRAIKMVVVGAMLCLASACGTKGVGDASDSDGTRSAHGTGSEQETSPGTESLTLSAGALAQQAPAQSRALVIGKPEEGVSLVVSGTEVWVQCEVQDEDTGKVRTAKGACRTIGWGLITNDTSSDRVVLCRECSSEENSENTESIIGVIDPWGKPAWNLRHHKWFENEYDAGRISLADVTRNGRVEILLVSHSSGGSGSVTGFYVLSWVGAEMKEVFGESLSWLDAGSEEGWNNPGEGGNAIDIMIRTEGPFAFKVTPFVVKNGKPKYSKPREFVWNRGSAIFEEIKAGKK